MNLRGLLGGLFGKRRIVRETRPMRVTPWYLGHGLTAAELTCACGHTWLEVGPPHIWVQPCPACGAVFDYCLPAHDYEPPAYSDGPWLTGEFDPLLQLAAQDKRGVQPYNHPLWRTCSPA